MRRAKTTRPFQTGPKTLETPPRERLSGSVSGVTSTRSHSYGALIWNTATYMASFRERQMSGRDGINREGTWSQAPCAASIFLSRSPLSFYTGSSDWFRPHLSRHSPTYHRLGACCGVGHAGFRHRVTAPPLSTITSRQMHLEHTAKARRTHTSDHAWHG
ncbi:hypothetical protein TRIATDRAFT_300334 [Trichoderma atroviride IMI 206040]|uniref:Uncharacterized protein n=1 Tax=Hypocrea atroviridis (strain ATCC 20476 / IMI 206040) TaxID=452589 RepID=G9NZS8_HYPAI|nr:uncharacterized protein TRIATDRAFT_300334 [Trichoderma atroviride IMI 206040]EHK43977.1 hypothetical protein TRIATDRAFT_300334 [Trichoderma atroviride IMI 206040]